MEAAVKDVEQVVIVGSGPAGYTAALYTARANLEPLVIEGFMWGGLLQQTTDVENFPGFPQGIMGPELMTGMRAQAERFGARFLTDEATELRLSDEPGGIHEVSVGPDTYYARTVVLAMGAEHKKLGVAGEEELSGRGVSYCATCDAAFFRDKPIVVVGGGDSAMEEAIFLAKFGSSVKVIHRRDEFRASQIMLERARSEENIELLTPYEVLAFEGEPQLQQARLRNTETGEERVVEMSGAFIAIGHEPQSDIAEGLVPTDDEGYVVTEGKSTRTGLPGVFAAGDLVDHTYRQAITAAGSGCAASIDAERWLAENPAGPHRDTAPPPTPGVDGAEVDQLDSIHARSGGPRAGGAGGSVDEGSPEPAGDAVPAPS
jgi:thioredoxin reductase (NADPH)